MTRPRRPLLAIAYGDGSAPPMSLADAAASLCDIVWVFDSHASEEWIGRLLPKLGQTVDIAGMSEDEAADALRAKQPDGIVAYADAQLAMASTLAERLGLDYFDRAVTERLLDKVEQRRAFREAGLPAPRCTVIPPHPTPENVDALAATLNFPVVLKPRHGAASRDTHLVSDVAHLGQLLAQLFSTDSHAEMVVEEYMAAASPSPSSHYDDYVSVESVVVDGQISHLAVAGRMPAAKPFRETGLIIPTDYPPSLVEEILDVATQAIRALGIHIGCLHTEIKVTDKGLRVIEVNGRLGGFVPQTLALASPGINLFEISLRVALGERVVFDELIPTSQVGYVVVGQPPLWAHRVEAVDGLDRLAQHPGVDKVVLSRQPGDEVDWRKGSYQHVFSVLGVASDHEAVQDFEQFIEDEVTIAYG